MSPATALALRMSNAASRQARKRSQNHLSSDHQFQNGQENPVPRTAHLEHVRLQQTALDLFTLLSPATVQVQLTSNVASRHQRRRRLLLQNQHQSQLQHLHRPKVLEIRATRMGSRVPVCLPRTAQAQLASLFQAIVRVVHQMSNVA